VAISLLVWLGVITRVGEFGAEAIASALQDFLVCVEMLLVAIWHHWVFPFQVGS
jgi:hypothetical protein